jgi:hypothetical protein
MTPPSWLMAIWDLQVAAKEYGRTASERLGHRLCTECENTALVEYHQARILRAPGYLDDPRNRRGPILPHGWR